MISKIDKEKIKTWFVTGASSGVGQELCRQLLARGYNVIAVARRVPDFKHKNALCLSCDVTNPDEVQNAITKGLEVFGKIDVLSNNAGISANITCEEENIDHLKQVMEVNYFGAFNTINAILPHFRENNNGTIISNTSKSGLAPRAYGTAYCSSKFAIEGLTGVVWHETKSFCRVMAFELGWFEGTEIGIKKKIISPEFECYKNLPIFYKPLIYDFRNDLSIAVKTIIDTVEKEKLPRHLILGKDALETVKYEIKALNLCYNYCKKIGLYCSIPLKKDSFLSTIFSIKNEYKNGTKRKIITILGIKLKIKAEIHMVVRERVILLPVKKVQLVA